MLKPKKTFICLDVFYFKFRQNTVTFNMRIKKKIMNLYNEPISPRSQTNWSGLLHLVTVHFQLFGLVIWTHELPVY